MKYKSLLHINKDLTDHRTFRRKCLLHSSIKLAVVMRRHIRIAVSPGKFLHTREAYIVALLATKVFAVCVRQFEKYVHSTVPDR